MVNHLRILLWISLAGLFLACGREQPEGFSQFVGVRNGRLYEGNKELRFISFNIPNLHYIEDHLPFTETNPWRLPDEFEIRDALRSVRQMGGQVVRIYTLSVKSSRDGKEIPRHVLGPGTVNEEAFRTLDLVLKIAREEGIRLIVPFVDNWKWWGGVAEYAAFRGKSKEAFWHDPQIMADFKAMIDYVLNRSNTYTGLSYKDDPTILAWETGNELTCPAEWTADIAAFIKSRDRKHLLMDGFHTQILRDASLQDPNIDIVTTHHYEKHPDSMAAHIRQNAERARGKKAYVVGEFGFIDTPGVRKVLDAVIRSGCSGALIWSLRFHNRDGGFYWHSEPYGGNLFKAYHWPGFPSGEPYDESGCLELMRQKAFEIRRLPIPPLEPPEPPKLLPVPSVAAVSWQGSAGASFYIIERAEAPEGPWSVIVDKVNDAEVQYRPLFNDRNVKIGQTFYYRIRAGNYAGISEPSNVEAAPPVDCLTLVDECADWSLVYSRDGEISLKQDEARRAKEDIHRFRCQAGASIVYRCEEPIRAIRLYTFITQKTARVRLFGSGDGRNWRSLVLQASFIAGDEGDYRYWRPAIFSSADFSLPIIFVKVLFDTETELVRTEIEYGS